MLAQLAPPGTWRGRILQMIAHGGAILIREGPISFLRTTLHRVYFYWILRTTYQQWVQENTPRGVALAQQRARGNTDAQTFPSRPLISLITPVFNPPPPVLRAMLESVLAQTYDHWELCLVDGASTRAGVKATLAEYTQKDPRIRLQTLTTNLGISGNSNIALHMAQGEYIQLLDHDDTLTPDALFEIVQTLNENPETDLLYFDEDKLSEDGRRRRGPIFKPHWSPDMLLSANYLSHCLIRRSLAVDAGLFNPEMDGAQDWDLAFRVTERTNRILHLPKVLYNWRQVRGSTAIVADAKTGVFAAQIKSVQNHLRRAGLENVTGTVTPPGTLRFHWPVSGAKVSIILPIPDKTTLPQTIEPILQKTQYPDYELILIGEKLPEHPDPRVRIVDISPIHYNLGAKHAEGHLLLFLSAGLVPLDSDWLEEMVRWAERSEIGVVGAKLISPNGTIQHAGLVFDTNGQAHSVFQDAPENARGAFGTVDWVRNYSAVSGACMMMRREVYAQLGGFDEADGADRAVDLCLRAGQRVGKLGYRIVYTPFARLKWSKNPPREQNPLPIKNEHLQKLAHGDPYFNPNLTFPHLLPVVSGKQSG